MYYRVVCMVVPLVLAGVARASDKRWAATTVATVYWLFWAGMGWILPLFPAEPKLGPVYHQVTQFVPPEFPMLLFIPALALDLLWNRTRDWNLWKKAAVSGLAVPGRADRGAVAVRRFPEFRRARRTGSSTPTSSITTRARLRSTCAIVFVKPDAPSVFWMEIAPGRRLGHRDHRLGFAWGDWMRRVRR